MFDSLWGEEFNIKEVDPKKLISKVENPKAVVKTVDQLLKSKKTTLDEKLAIITENVKRILGKYAENTQVIRTKEELIEYFDDAIKNNIIALDTETNNSLQPITCKLMGPCLFTPGRKAAYVPINHTNKDTGELLSNQLTEEDIAEQLNRLKEAQTKILMHNGKFDYKVFKCTTGVELTVYWDTLLAAKVLDENEEAGLKEQYVKHIDPSIEKYSINHLFAGIEYAVVDPEIFALYAATDAMMTYYLYKWQEERFKLPGCERLFKIFKDVEMQVMPVTAEMELTGLEIDREYTQKLAVKYHNKVDQIDKEIAEAISKYDDLINSWRSKPESNKRPTTYYFDTLKEDPTKLDDYKELCAGKIIKGYPKNDANGKGPYKVGKSPSELLENPINLGSPSQLAILLYDIVGVKPPDPKKPRGTGEDELKAIKLPLCKLLLERRGIVKLVDAFIDSLPNEILKETGRVHAGFNQYGAKTGRYSCSEPNLQQIPAKNKEIRLMFKAGYTYRDSILDEEDSSCILNYDTEVETSNGWTKVVNLTSGCKIKDSDEQFSILKQIEKINDNKYRLIF